MELIEAKEILKENGYIMSGLDYDRFFNHIFGKSKKELQKEKDERKEGEEAKPGEETAFFFP